MRQTNIHPFVPERSIITTEKIIAIGASTGGIQALNVRLASMPATSPGIVMVQHMPSKFTAMFAERLNNKCTMIVKEAEHEEEVTPGKVLIAPGGATHMSIKSFGEGGYKVQFKEGPRINGHIPSVDFLFNSVAENAGENAAGVILTGMGNDGAEGLLKMRQLGAITIGQDEKTSAVFGMPKVAFDIGAVISQLSIDKIPQELVKIFEK